MIFQILYVGCCIYLISLLMRRNSKKSTSQPPVLSGGWPLIGHAWKVLGDRKHAFNVVQSMSKEILANGGVMTINFGPQIAYALSDPDDAARVANECLGKDYFYNFAKPFLGNGITIAEVPLWKQHRKLLSSAFRQQMLNEYLVVFNEQARRLIAQFKPELDKRPFNHEKYIRLNSLESICMTSFGADVADFGGIHKQFIEGASEILEIFTERFQKIWLHSDFIYNWSNTKKRQDVCVRKIKKFTSAIIAKRKAESQEIKSGVIKSGQFTPFLSYLLEISQNTDCYSEEDILHETNTLVAAGYDTSACTITLVLLLLGSHLEIQTKAYQELQEVFGDSNRDVTKEDLNKLVYLDAVIKETFRLYPIGPIISRYIAKDIQLRNYTLKAGNSVAILIWALHRHPIWGPDVELFRPDRWLDGSLPSNSNAYAAFSIGRRSCIGKMYAMMSAKTTLAHLLRSYQISADISKVEFEIHAILRPSSGHHISIKERNPLSKDKYLN